MIAFLASPMRVLTALNRALVLLGIMLPFLYFGWRIWPLVLIFGTSANMCLTLVTYGADNMIRKPVPWRLWLWRHVEVWWINPEDIP